MKKVLFITALVITMSLDMFAQRSDGFFTTNNSDIYNRITDDPNGLLNMPVNGLGTTANEPAPRGSGLLILTAAGLGYAIKKRKK